MKLFTTALGLLPLVLAGSIDIPLGAERVAGAQSLRRVALEMRDPAAATPSAQPTAAQPAGSPSQTDTNAACQSQLAKLNGVPSNPSGKSACYNVAAMDMETGAFQTEVYLYDIGLPTGLWASLLNHGETVSLQYPGGQVQGKAQRLAMPPPGGNPTLNASVLFTGQLNSTMKSMMSNAAAMRMALMPMITIKAETSDGQFLTTNMSNQEAAFINGQFSDPSFTASQAAEFAATGTPFVLPGTTLGIFPIAFVVTMIWTVLFSIAVGLGTLGRYEFRVAYRRRAGHIAPAPSQVAAGGKVAAYDKR